MDSCTRFGIVDGCKSWCPVLLDGECPIQDEWVEVDGELRHYEEIESENLRKNQHNTPSDDFDRAMDILK